MIGERAADMIKGRQLEPYEPDSPSDAESRYRAPLRGAHSRAMPVHAAPPVQQLSQKQQQFNSSQHLDLNHNHHHHHFIHNKYGSSIMAENIIKKMI